MNSWKDKLEIDYETVLCHYLPLTLIITSDTLLHRLRLLLHQTCWDCFLFFSLNGAILKDRMGSSYCSRKTNRDVFNVIRKERTNV